MSLVIDLHSHVLPGIDDGAHDLEESLAIDRAAASARARRPSPRRRICGPTTQECGPATSPTAVAQLNERIPPELGVRVMPGAEVDLLWAQSATDEDLRLASFDQRGTDLLVETPYGPLPQTTSRTCCSGWRSASASCSPIRSAAWRSSATRAASPRLVRRGVLVQVTLPSLISSPNPKSRTRQLALDLIAEGLAHNLATDAHSPGPVRPPRLAAAVEIASQVAPARAEWMVTDAPAAILAGEPLPAPPAETPRPLAPAPRQSRLSRLLRR